MKQKLFSFFGLFFGLFFIMTLAEGRTIQERRNWSGIDLRGPFAPDSKFFYDLFPEARSSITTGEYNQTHLNAAIAYNVTPNFNVWLGSTMVLPGTANREERLWQQIVWNILNNETIIFAFRSRLQENRRENFSQWLTLFRQRATLSLPKLFFHKVTPIIYDEIFIHLNHPIWDNSKTLSQNRYFAGLRFPLAKSASLDLGYLNQYLFRNTTNQMNHIIYVNLNINT